MKHGILILAHQHFDHLLDLVSQFDQDFFVYIHLDRRATITNHQIRLLKENPQVQFVSQELKVNWGGINHLKAILLLAEEAIKNGGIDYFHVISGQDYPIKKINSFKKFFEENPCDYLDFFEVSKSTWKEEWMSRLRYYGLYEVFSAKSVLGRKLINGIILFQRKLGFSRRLPTMTLYGGSGWWSLRQASVKYVLDVSKQNPLLLRRLRYTFCADEIYFQTILLNSPKKNEIVNNNLRFIDWTKRNGNFPANLDETDFDALINSDRFFARRFDFPVSGKLKERMNHYLKGL